MAVATKAPCRLTTMVSPSHSAPPSMAITTLRGTRVLRRDSRKVMRARLTDNFCRNPLNDCDVAISSTGNLVYADQLSTSPNATWLCDQRFGSRGELRFSLDRPQCGKISSMEYVTKADLCRRLSRSMKLIASKNPVKAPRHASEIERRLKVRSPWPVRRNPVYAISTVQRITRTGSMANLSRNKRCHIVFHKPEM